jgi:hypothetical protein
MNRGTDWLLGLLVGATVGVLILAWGSAILYVCYSLATRPLNELLGWALTCVLTWQG